MFGFLDCIVYSNQLTSGDTFKAMKACLLVYTCLFLFLLFFVLIICLSLFKSSSHVKMCHSTYLMYLWSFLCCADTRIIHGFHCLVQMVWLLIHKLDFKILCQYEQCSQFHYQLYQKHITLNLMCVRAEGCHTIHVPLNMIMDFAQCFVGKTGFARTNVQP